MLLLILALCSCNKKAETTRRTLVDNDILYLNQRFHLKQTNDTTLIIDDVKIIMQTVDSVTNAIIQECEDDSTIETKVKMEINRSGKYIKFGEIYFPLLKHKE